MHFELAFKIAFATDSTFFNKKLRRERTLGIAVGTYTKKPEVARVDTEGLTCTSLYCHLYSPYFT